MNRLKTHFLLVGSMVLLFCTLISAQELPKATLLKGKIIDAETKKGIKKAKLYYIKKDGKYVFGKNVNTDGSFSLDLLPGPLTVPGRLGTFLAKAEGYYENEEEIIIEAGVNNIEFELKKIPVTITKSYPIKYRNDAEIYHSLRSLYPPKTIERGHNTIIVNATRKRQLEIAQKIKELDLPLRNVKLVISLIRASNNSSGSTVLDHSVKGILGQLKTLFTFNNYTLIGRAVGMGLENSNLRFSSTRIDDNSALFNVGTFLEVNENVIKLKDLKIDVELPIQNQLQTTINIKDKQTLILGGSGGLPKEGALITVITAEIVE